jgi:hypothetical protein
MTLGPFIHCIREFLKYENALDLGFFEKLASNNSCLWKSDFNFEKLASNIFDFENLVANLKNYLVTISNFENLVATLQN